MPSKIFTCIIALLLAFACISMANAETTTAKERISTSIINGQTTVNKYPPVPQWVNDLTRTDQPASVQQGLTRNILSIDHGLWIYDLSINLNSDNDADGYFSNFSTTLDIDNSFSPIDVYAVFYLSQNHGPWLEYAATDNFIVSGTSPNDSISIEASLDVGYPSDYYDLGVEIYDAYTGTLLLSYGPQDNIFLIDIPFESRFNDSFQSEVSIGLSFTGSGSISLLTLLFFLSLIVYQAVWRTRVQY